MPEPSDPVATPPSSVTPAADVRTAAPATSPPPSPVPATNIADTAYERLRAMSLQLLTDRNRKLLMDYLRLRHSLRTPDRDV
jgi:hypothetical protein